MTIDRFLKYRDVILLILRIRSCLVSDGDGDDDGGSKN